MKRLFSAILTSVMLAIAAPAMAAHGYVNGYVTFFQTSGQTCDSNIQDCSGARYLESERNSQRPVRQAIVEVLDQNNAKIGESYTGTDGFYNVVWYRTTPPTSAKTRIVWAHYTWRFSVRDRGSSTTGNGANWITDSAAFNAPANTYVTNNVTLGGHEIYNAYDASYRMWADALVYVANMNTRFVDARIFLNHVGLGNNAADFQTTSRGVRLGANTGNSPMIIQHELGHMATWLGKVTNGNQDYVFCGAYNYPNTCNGLNPGTQCGGVHSFSFPEHRCASFDEGIANFIGLVASHWWNSNQPMYCFSEAGSCASGFGIDVERRVGACVTDEGLAELSVQRFLWDLYDSRQDNNYADTDGANTSSTFSYSNLIGVLQNYGTGNGSGTTINEPWDGTFATIDNQDGRSSWAYQAVLGAGNWQRTNNCSP